VLTIAIGTTLNITGGGPGVTDVVAGSSLNVAGTFELGGNPAASALAQLTSVEGNLALSGQTLTDTPIGGTLTVASSGGQVNLTNATNLSVSGNVTNSRSFLVGNGGSGNDVLNVSGTLTNNGDFELINPGDTANVKVLSNTGSITINPGTVLNITGGGSGITDVVANSSLNVAGTFELGGNAANSALAQLTSVEGSLTLSGQTLTDTPIGGTLTVAPSGLVNLTNATKFSVNGNVGNSGRFWVGSGSPGNDVLTTSGTFTNNSTGDFEVLGAADVASVNALSTAGSVFVNNGSTLNLAGAGTSNNSGTITLGGGTFSSANTGATFNNTGTVQTQSSPSTMAFGGTFNNATGGTLNLNVSGDKAQISTLTNGGMVNVASGALLVVGSGAFGASSGYQQLANGTLNEFLGGTTAGSFGVINVTGSASLSGLLGITLANGFNPTGDTFDILNFTGSRTGTFSNGTSFQADGFNWTLTYNPNDILLTAGSIVPGLVAATWSTTGGNWTDQTRWSCNPSFSPCMPNNANGTAFTANINSPGNTLTLDSSSTPTSITINSLALTAGTLNIGSGATLNLVNQPNGIMDIAAGAGLDVAGTFEVNGATNALAKLASVEGSLTLDGQTTNIGNALTVASGGFVNLLNATKLSVTGNLSNSGQFLLGNGGSGNSVLNVSGTLTNNANGTFDLLAAGDTANVAALSNAGAITINPGTTLNITGGGPGITDVVANSSLNVAGTFEVGGNPATSGLAQLANVEGSLILDAQTLNDTPAGGTFTVASGGSLNLADGTSMSINGTLVNGGTVLLTGTGSTLSAGLTNTGSIAMNGNSDALTDSGDFNNNSGGSLALNADLNSVSVSGNFNNNAGASVNMNGTNGKLSVTGLFNNGGAVNLGGSNNTLTATGAFTNSGNVTIGASDTLNAKGGYSQSGGGTTVRLGGTISAPTFVVGGGTVQGGGTIAANVQNTGGTITPTDLNNKPSTLTVNGNFAQGTNGTLVIDLGGTGSGQFSVLSISGTANLGGMVDFTALGGFTPGAGETFTFLLASLGVSGTFADQPPVLTNFVCPIGSTCTDVYGPNSVSFEISASTTPTPEPGTMILIGTGLLSLGGLTRRKKARTSRATVGC
jgi:fibronectin-binding autotransporter adhesin